ncbi:Hint domain-containing protein [Ensifer sp. IC3342]|nr:Hint domain-containing protein [Ensifer sp. BRP08]MCA1447571.1 Hint domain-containing protein [Ensifer sp. IC3342]
MSSAREQRPQLNRARRHFLGLAAATGVRIAAMGTLAVTTLFPSSTAHAQAAKPGNGPKPGRGPGNNPGKGQKCLLRGTSVMTPGGEARIEDLRIGDLVETLQGEARAIKWIGRHLYRLSGSSWNDSVVPIRIRRHALDEHTPHRDLYLSAGHALFIDGVLIRVQYLVNGTSIAPALPTEEQEIEYFHIMLDTHDVILAEGTPVETLLLEAGIHEGFTNFAEFARLYPAPQPQMTPFAPIVGYGGRAHLKALLRLAAGRFARTRAPIDEAYERIAARGEELVG